MSQIQELLVSQLQEIHVSQILEVQSHSSLRLQKADYRNCSLFTLVNITFIAVVLIILHKISYRKVVK